MIHSLAFAQEKTKLINSRELITEARNFANNGNYEQAIEKLKVITRNDSNYIESLKDLGLYYVNNKEYDKGLETAVKGLQFNSSHYNVFMITKALSLTELNRPKESIDYLKGELKRFPYFPAIYFNIAYAYEKLDTVQAISYYQQSLKLNPYYHFSYYNLGLLEYERRNIIPAMICFYNYLLVNPNGSNAQEALKRLSSIAKTEIDFDGKADDDETFKELELLIASRAALNKNYKTLVKIDDALINQTQLFLEKIAVDANSKDFYMSTYVPFFVGVNKNNYIREFTYTLLSGFNVQAVQSYIKSNQKRLDLFAKWAAEELNKIYATKEIEENGIIKKVSCLYYDNNHLWGMGELTEGQNSKMVGDWTFYYSNGVISSKGKFDANGNKTGRWTYYYDNGTIKEVADMKDGKNDGLYEFYHNNGAINYRCNMVNDNVDGELLIYDKAGKHIMTKVFSGGELNGKYIEYFGKDVKEVEANYSKGKIEGKAIVYFPDGKQLKTMYYKGGELNGEFVEYYKSGNIYSKGNYLNGYYTGEWTIYHDNGKVREIKKYGEKGVPVGVWKSYYENGNLLDEKIYNAKGQLNGEYKEYGEDGKLYYTFIYLNDLLKSYTFYKKDGTIASEGKEKSKVIHMKAFYEDGVTMRAEGKYLKGKEDGEWKFYDKYGKLSKIENYKDGQIVSHKSFFKNGEIKDEGVYQNGMLDGYYKSYFVNGKTYAEGWYRADKQEGYWYYYHPNGKLNSVYYYENGEKTGFVEEYDIVGTKYKETEYRDGILVKDIYMDSTGTVYSESVFVAGSGNLNHKYKHGPKMVEGKMVNGDWEDKVVWYHGNGKVAEVINYHLGYKHGKSETYRDNGKPHAQGQYYFGQRHGEWKWLQSNGKLSHTGKYTYDTRDSIWNYYYSDGSIFRKASFKYNKLEGEQVYYAPDGGEIALIRTFKDDELVSYSYLDKNKERVPEIAVNNEVSTIVGYYSNGNKSYEYTLKYGEREGKTTMYYTTGQKYFEESYADGYQTGEAIYYYKNGKVLSRENYSFDELNGPCFYYYENGKLKAEENYILGVKHGKFKYYDQNGKVTEVKVYNYGDLIK
ncbi:MAG TPA: hypothetical protein VIK89_01615 [Cytophagaceae bacterium]